MVFVPKFESSCIVDDSHEIPPPYSYIKASIGNGTMAIVAGIVAQLLEDWFGHIGPFQGAIALTTLALWLSSKQ